MAEYMTKNVAYRATVYRNGQNPKHLLLYNVLKHQVFALCKTNEHTMAKFMLIVQLEIPLIIWEIFEKKLSSHVHCP